MAPEGWSSRPLGQIAKISSGGTPSRANAAFWGGNIPWVTTAEVSSSLICDTKEKITQLGLESSSAKLYQPGTILLAMYGQGKTRGQVAMLGIQATTNQACAAIVLKQNLDRDFYFYYLQSRYEHIRGLSNSGSQENLSAGLIKEITVPIPPAAEQAKIAKILSTWDQAISTAEQLLVCSQRQKKAQAHRLLTGKQRLSGFSSEWKTILFGEAFRERVETGFIALPLLSITSEDGVVDREETGRKDTSNSDKSKYLRICPGDIGYNTMRMWQGVSGLSELEGLVSPAYTVLTPQLGIDPLFAAYLFKLPALVHVFYRHSQGLVSDTWNLKYSNFAKIKWSIPDIEEQKAIAAVLANADREIEIMQLQVAGLKQEKKALMQQLFTGKRRVTVDTKEAV